MARSSLPRTPLTAPAAAPTWQRLKQLFAGRRGGPQGRDGGASTGFAQSTFAQSTLADTPRRLPRATDYALRHVIARSDRTTIYSATEVARGHLVAMKTVRLGRASDAERTLWRERFLREAAAAARLKHEHIVRVHAGGVQGEGDALTGWLAMEWVHGTDMSRYTTPARLLPEAVVVGIAQRVALALAFAHRSGVVHRDVKPTNVLFDPSTGTVKVTDFGSARLADATATRSGLMIGTPAYMAPEQLLGADPSPQSDLYSLGVMLFELLVGQRPFQASSMGQLLAQIAHQTAPRVRTLRPELPELLDDIVARLLAKTPAMRQPNGHQLAIELRLAQAQCSTPEAGSAVAAWADPPVAAEPTDAPAKGGAGATAFQGTIAD